MKGMLAGVMFSKHNSLSEPLSVKIGEVHTAYHHMKLRVQTACYEDVEPQLQPAQQQQAAHLAADDHRADIAINPVPRENAISHKNESDTKTVSPRKSGRATKSTQKEVDARQRKSPKPAVFSVATARRSTIPSKSLEADTKLLIDALIRIQRHFFVNNLLY